MQGFIASVTALLIAAEWHGHITVVVVIHEDRTGLQAATHAVCAQQITGPDRGAQTVVAVVGQRQSFGFTVKGKITGTTVCCMMAIPFDMQRVGFGIIDTGAICGLCVIWCKAQ